VIPSVEEVVQHIDPSRFRIVIDIGRKKDDVVEEELAAVLEHEPQPTSVRLSGVHSRRLMAAFFSSQLRGACSSSPVAAR
jgi:hypothetical protein